MSASLSRDSAEKALNAKLGMTRHDRDHRWFVLEVEGKEVARTCVSTGGQYKTLGHDLVAKMARQLYVPTAFLVGIVSCSKSKDDYLAHLRANGRL